LPLGLPGAARGFSSSPLQGKLVVFDESHTPAFTTSGEFSNFSQDIASLGYTVQVMSSWNSTLLGMADVLVLPMPTSSYSRSEYIDMHRLVSRGGGLLIIGEYNGGSPAMAQVAGWFNVTFAGGRLCDKDDHISGIAYWIDWRHISNFARHPITTGVTRVETYYGDGVSLAPPGATPILMMDADSNSYWYGTGNLASGVPSIVAFDYQYGLGRVVVCGDGNMFASGDYDSDGTETYYDADNEVLARNIIDWLADASPTSRVALFDESHTPGLSIGSHPAQLDVLFEESHNPFNQIDKDNDGVYGYSDDGSGYGDFAAVLEGAGFNVANISKWSAGTIQSSDVVVIAAPSTAYSDSELETISDFVRTGGGLLIIGEGGAFLSTAMHQLARLFGADYYAGCVNDTDEYYGSQGYWVRFDGANLNGSHPAMNGVWEVGYIYGTAFNATPANAQVLVGTDNDATATWYSTPPGNPSAQNLPCVIAFRYGEGRVVITGDMSLWYNSTVSPFLSYGNNSLFGINIVRWLGEPSYTPYMGYFEYHETANRIRAAGFGVRAMFEFDQDVIEQADVLVAISPFTKYSSAELNAIKSYVDNHGGGLLIIGDYPPHFLKEAADLAALFGIKYVNTTYISWLEDTDDNAGIGPWMVLEADNIMAGHPVTSGVAAKGGVLVLASGGIGVVPSGAASLLYMDSDSTAQWINGSSAAGVTLMCALNSSRGRVAAIGDTNLWAKYTFSSASFGDNKTMTIDYLGNLQLLINTLDWLTENRPPTVQVLSPNGGETITGIWTVNWTADDYDGDPLTFTISYSGDGGSTWTTIATGITGTTYNWDTTLLPDGSLYLIRVTASDGTTTAHDESDDVFTLFNHPAPPIPGFPWESTALGLAASLALILVIRHKRRTREDK